MLRSLLIARTFVALLLTSVTLAVGDQSPASHGRALPLNKLPIGRATTDEHGFFRMATAVGDDYFDGTSDQARVRRHLETARKAGVQYLRCAFSWNGIEIEKGRFDWRFWDMLVALSEEYGIQLMPYVAYTPEWAAAKPEEFWKQPPRDTQDYVRLMATIAARYKGRIHSWELWNEPDLSEYWQGTAPQFAEMVKQAAMAVRESDPEAVIVLGGISRAHDPFLRKLITEHHVDRFVDVVAIHGYPESWLPERIETVFGSWVEEVGDMLQASGSGVDLWVNEMGYADWRYSQTRASIYGSPIYFDYEHTRNYGADALFKSQTLALASGEVSMTGWYRIDDFCNADFSGDALNYHLGLLDCAGKAKPAMQALAHFNNLFGQPVRAAQVPFTSSQPNSAQAVVKAIERPDGHVVVAGWLRSPWLAGSSPATGKAPDGRSERVRLNLPCTAASVRFSGATGGTMRTDAKVSGREIRDLLLRGDRVIIADVTCVTADRDRLPLTRSVPSATLSPR